MKRILIVEDKSHIAASLEKSLRANGFVTAVAQDGYSAIHMTRSHNFDLLIIDLGFLGKDRATVIEELRGQGEQLPIIILTARNDVKDNVAALKGGLNDYVTKPFSFEELLARVRLRLQDNQVPKRKQEMLLGAGNIVLDLPKRTLKVGDRTLELSSREIILLETFVRHPDQVLSRENLLNYVWGYNCDHSSKVVDVYVGYLRKKLGGDLIETVRGRGYRLRMRKFL